MAIWLYRIGNIALNSLNAFWFYKMLSGALKVLGGDAAAALFHTKLAHSSLAPSTIDDMHRRCASLSNKWLTQVATPTRPTSDD